MKIHVQRVRHTHTEDQVALEARKLMHRFSHEQVEGLIEEVQTHT